MAEEMLDPDENAASGSDTSADRAERQLYIAIGSLMTRHGRNVDEVQAMIDTLARETGSSRLQAAQRLMSGQ